MGILTALVICLLGHVLADEYVVKLDSELFSTQVEEKPHFVMFFAPWCGHCKRLQPIWDELGEKMYKEKMSVEIAKVDCTVHTALCSEEDVTGYPTLKFFKSGRDGSVKYRGPRDLSSLAKFVHEQMGVEATPLDDEDEEVKVPAPVNGLIELTEAAFTKHIEQGQHFIKFYAPWCGHCQKLAPVWDDLAKSLEHDKSVTIAKVDCTQHRSVCTDMEVKGYPTLLWIQDGKMVQKYSGSRTIDDLKRFVVRMKEDDEVVDTSTERAEGTVSSVVQLTTETFSSVIDDGVTFVKFYAPWCGHCKRLAPIWEELAIKFIGNAQVKIADVDCTMTGNKDLCSQYDVTGFPTLLLFRSGETIGEYEGTRDLPNMHLYVNNNLVKEEL